MDILLKKLFEIDRWEAAINTAVEKGINKSELRALCTPEKRAEVYLALRDGNYHIAPPRTGQIPKDDGTFRTVYINTNMDRVLLSIINDMLFELCHEMVHPRCKSYQKGIGCGKVVQEVSKLTITTRQINGFVGYKSDLSKYFDSVPLQYIDSVFDSIEKKWGKSKVIDVCREYYHTDLYYNDERELVEKYQSLKQGCALASFLADAILYHLDDEMSKINGFYVRYSDDILFIGEDYPKAMEKMRKMLADMQLTLNPKKVEYITPTKWFKFLGFSIRGSEISLSKSRLKTFQKEIQKRSSRDRKLTPEAALRKVHGYLYGGEYSWATSVLGIINNEHDINELNKFVLDALKSTYTDHRHIGGLGYLVEGKDGVIARGKGRNVAFNRKEVGEIAGYISLKCARNALLINKEVYDALVS